MPDQVCQASTSAAPRANGDDEKNARAGEGKRTLLSAGLLDLGAKADTDETVEGLELLHGLGRVVDEGEASGLAATELGAQTEDGDLVLLGLVQATELLAELILGDVGAVGVEDVTRGKKQSAFLFEVRCLPSSPQLPVFSSCRCPRSIVLRFDRAAFVVNFVISFVARNKNSS